MHFVFEMGRSQLRLCAGIRLTFLSFMSTSARLQCARCSALLGLEIASLVLRQTCHSRLPGVASTQFVMTMHRWLRVSACAVIVMVRERRGFDAIY